MGLSLGLTISIWGENFVFPNLFPFIIKCLILCPLVVSGKVNSSGLNASQSFPFQKPLNLDYLWRKIHKRKGSLWERTEDLGEAEGQFEANHSFIHLRAQMAEKQRMLCTWWKERREQHSGNSSLVHTLCLLHKLVSL